MHAFYKLLVIFLLVYPGPSIAAQKPDNLGSPPYQKMPSNYDDYKPRRELGAGLRAGTPASYFDKRYLYRQNPASSLSEVLNTGIRDGFIYVNGAIFLMGGAAGDPRLPAHRVQVNSYWISPYEVYWKLWHDVYRWAIKNGYKINVGRSGNRGFRRADNPVVFISWYDAIVWCNAYSELRGLEAVYRYNSTVERRVIRSSKQPLRRIRDLIEVNWEANGYRLPTEAEWEFAARGGVAGKGYLFSGSNSSVDIAWNKANNVGRGIHPSGTLRPNELNLFDMSGNVGEWVWDWYAADYYYRGPVINPQGPGTGRHKVIRGGFWRSEEREVTVAARWAKAERRRMIRVGFRPVRSAVFHSVNYTAAVPADILAKRISPSADERENEIETPASYANNFDSPYIYSLEDPNAIFNPQNAYRQ